MEKVLHLNDVVVPGWCKVVVGSCGPARWRDVAAWMIKLLALNGQRANLGRSSTILRRSFRPTTPTIKRRRWGQTALAHRKFAGVVLQGSGTETDSTTEDCRRRRSRTATSCSTVQLRRSASSSRAPARCGRGPSQRPGLLRAKWSRA